MTQGGSRPGAGRKPGTGPYGEATRVMRVPASRVAEIKAYLATPARPGLDQLDYLGTPHAGDGPRLPLYAARVPAGFPSPAEDYAEVRLDLNEYLVEHAGATFYLHVQGHSMTGAGILDGDVIAVDRALEARHGDIVLAVVDNALTVKELYQEAGEVRLLSHNPDFPPITFKPGQELSIWGVVKAVVRKLR